MNLKASKSGLKKVKLWIQMITFIVASSAVMEIHCCIWFEQKIQLWGTFRGGIKGILQHLYLNDYAEFDSKIMFIMFLHDYQLTCEISTVRTLALKLCT